MISAKKKSRGRTEDDRPNPIDVHIGTRMCQRRRLFEISQEELGKRVGLTFQQIQKYEKGQNRVSGSRLWMISRVLQVPVDYFFSGMEEDTLREGERLLTSFDTRNLQNFQPDEIFQRKDVLELVTAYVNSRHPDVAGLLKTALIKLYTQRKEQD